jgi:hypothetical protein
MPEPHNATPADEAFFAAVGHLTIAWAHVESGLDFAILIIYGRLGGDKIEPEMPRALQRKITYLRKAVNRMDQLAPFRPTFPSLADRIAEASEQRHDIVHGYAITHFEEGLTEVKFGRLLQGTFPREQKIITVTTEQVLRHASNARKLAIQSLRFCEELLPLMRT